MHFRRTVRLVALIWCAATAYGQSVPPAQPVQTIPLPAVAGRLDHLAVDLTGERLFVAALGNDSVEVIDLRSGTRAHSITGLHEPQGVMFVPALQRLFVSNGGTGTVDVLDSVSLRRITTVKFAGDADNLRYDAAKAQLWVGYGNGALGIVDAATATRLGDVPLPGHPEAFELEQAEPRIFVNVPSAKQIVVVDRQQRRVVATWKLTAARANFPMALDEAAQRLFVGFRKPATLTVFDTEAGTPVATLDTAGDADDLFYDGARRQVYVSGGEGFLDVFAQRDDHQLVRAARIPTAAGARTALFVPQLNRLYVAAPQHGGQGAEIRVYALAR